MAPIPQVAGTMQRSLGPVAVAARATDPVLRAAKLTGRASCGRSSSR